MNSEYVKFKTSEKKSIQKNFLTSELLLLDSLKRYRAYKQYRAEELLLKVALKTKIECLNNNISYFERLMPKTDIQLKEAPSEAQQIKNYTLEEEIDLIKRKLAFLNSEH